MPLTRFRMIGPHQTPVDNDEYRRLVEQDRALQRLYVGQDSIGHVMEGVNRAYIEEAKHGRMENTSYYRGKLEGMKLVVELFDKARRQKPENDLPF